VKNAVKMQVLAALVLFCAGWLLTACKSGPPLTKDQALTMIQAKYAQGGGMPFVISVNDRGMQQGVTAKYWVGTKRYPNGYWADFKLTPDGQKVLKLQAGGDMIQWRPESPTDPRYAVIVVPVAATHLEVRDGSMGDVQNLGDSKTVSYTEDVNMSALPDALQNIAHNPGNDLSDMRTATFALTNGAWTLQSIR
jgi:hypothetical protein